MKCFERRPPTVLVVGDVMCDNYISGTINRISPEAPVPIFESTGEFRRLGGAANVAANLRALGCDVRLLGVLGADAGAEHVRTLLHEQDIPDKWLIEDAARPTTEKTRLIAHQQHVLRLDRETQVPLAPSSVRELLAHAESLMEGVDGVICSDYHKGVCSQEVLTPLFRLARYICRPIVVDPKKQEFVHYRGATVITPNLTEVEQATRITPDCEDDLEEAAKILLHQSEAEALLVTRGRDGMSLFVPSEPPLHVPSEARDVFDVTGAGDTVIATFSMAVMCGSSFIEAVHLANFTAGIVVGKVGTAVVSLEELRMFVDEPKSTYSKRLNHDGSPLPSQFRRSRIILNNGSTT